MPRRLSALALLGVALATMNSCGTPAPRSASTTSARVVSPFTTVIPTTVIATSVVPAIVESTIVESTIVDVGTTSTTVPSTAAPVTTSAAVPATTAPGLAALDLLGFVSVANEHRGGYVRDLFGYPADFGHGCDTRAEVLKRDSRTPAQVDPHGCTVVAGDWLSPYDGVATQLPGELEIDHVVALKEAWDSGAWQWGTAALHAFGNDLSDARGLRAVSTPSNRDKGDKDPSNWLPPDPADVCRYIGDWVVIKVRWHLTMDQSEFGRVHNLLIGPCAGWRVDAFTPAPATLP